MFFHESTMFRPLYLNQTYRPLLALILFSAAFPAFAQTEACRPIIVNKSCTITIDREKPVVPLPTRAERDATVTIKVLRRPTEAASLSAEYKDVNLPDPLETLFGKALPALQMLTIQTTNQGGTIQKSGSSILTFTYATEDPLKPVLDELELIHGDLKMAYELIQKHKDKIDSSGKSLNSLRSSSWRDKEDKPEPVAFSNRARDLLEVLAVEGTACAGTNAALCPLPSLRAISVQYEAVIEKFGNVDRVKAAKLASYPATVQTLDAIASDLAMLEATLKELSEAQQALQKVPPILQPIQENPQFFDEEEYSVRQSAASGQSATVKVGVKDRFADKTTELGTVTIEWNGTRWEVSAGLLFSALPERTFAIAPQVNAQNVATQVVTETTKRPSFVAPAALAHYRLWETLAGGKRNAILLTGAVGLNTSTKLADFGVGLSYSYRGFVISPLLLFTRDQSLTNGFYVGQTAPDGVDTVSSGLHWVRKFAIGVSYRIPLK